MLAGKQAGSLRDASLPNFLDFEKPIAELEGKIEELRHLSDGGDGEINIEEEVGKLEDKADRLLRQTYTRLSSWQKVQVARHPDRPHFLAYANRLTLPVVVDEEEREVEFEKLGGIEHHGKVSYMPVRDGMDEMMGTVVEYKTDADVPNPRIQIVEIGRPEGEHGGNIEFLQGADIRTSEVDVLQMR